MPGTRAIRIDPQRVLVDRAAELDPDAAAVVSEIEATGALPWHELGVERAREVEAELFTPDDPPPVASVQDLAFDGPGGDVAVRAYRPAAQEPLPTVVFFHGGGWILGTLDSADDLCRELARRGSALVLSVDYRLAPEHHFPAAVEDAVAAVRWARHRATGLGGTPEDLHVAGSSAGGNLAAAAARRVARDRRKSDAHPLAGQLLLYPITDHAFDTPSYRENAEGPLLTRADMRWFWRQYLGPSGGGSDPDASVVRADLAGVAPATVVTAGFDPLADDGGAYATRLADAGVSVEHLHYPAMPHGFLSFADRVPAADAAFDDVVDAL